MDSITVKKPRLRLVCLQCKKIKRKCDKLRPACSRCQQNSLQCEYEERTDLSANVAANDSDGFNSSHKLNFEQQPVLERTGLRYSLQVPEGVVNATLSIWNAEDMLVIVGLVTFLDYPFAAHSLAQHDQYIRALCASLYGMALVDFSNYANGIPCEDTSRSILGPFSFIEKAIFRRIEHSKQFRGQPAALGLLYNAFSMEEENFSTLLPSLIAEVEDVLMQKKDCEILLRCFYQNIYPFYPFMDISLFESDLTSLLLQDDNNRWKISTEVKKCAQKNRNFVITYNSNGHGLDAFKIGCKSSFNGKRKCLRKCQETFSFMS
ncbi:AHG_G0031140.mRNA.1.CDS.1 [Saccharomyces cerevisiae]|nr:AHG_G0031140.mRNA.1.CDS.1 [Saccharomyces cerevisiae]CAI6752663.1 AHG_G0031140.mRNA.1.CDS.1 [Saccharomyces cerevisiae]